MYDVGLARMPAIDRLHPAAVIVADDSESGDAAGGTEPSHRETP
ncbi:MAG: hypothetical protein V2I67_07235 [Thermoanaerobaculales bacterium]|nr:hypothetical protein [Thermoanaerobaculales bacterium]